MKINSLFVWFLGSFIGAGLSVWFSFHWFLGGFVGALVGVVMTTRKEIVAFICAAFTVVKSLPRRAGNWVEIRIACLREDPLLRLYALTTLFRTIAFSHTATWFAALVLGNLIWFVFLPRTTNARLDVVFTYVFLPAALFLFLVIMPGLGFLWACGDVRQCYKLRKITILREFVRWRRAAKRYNLLCLPFSVLLQVVRKARRLWRKSNTREKWLELAVALHSRATVNAGIFCAIGSIVGYCINSPWIGGLAGMGIGIIEYLTFRILIQPRLVVGK